MNNSSQIGELNRQTSYLIFLLLVGFFVSCGEKSNQKNRGLNSFEILNAKLEKYTWLEGIWHAKDGKGDFHESWIINSDGSYEGSGSCQTLESGDTLFTEEIHFHIQDSSIYYTVWVNHSQNKTDFRLVNGGNDFFVCENPTHDFPQRIIYTRISGDSIIARTEGTVNGLPMVREFRMGKD